MTTTNTTDLAALSTKELVRHFNKEVVANHPTVAQIPGLWKESKAKLIAKIEALPAIPVKMTEEMAKAAKATGDRAIQDLPTRPAKIVPAKPTAEVKPAKVVKKAKDSGNHSPAEFGQYCTEHGLNPKVIRAKLRKAGKSAPYSVTDIKSLS